MSIVKKLQEEIAERYVLIRQIQEECTHPPSTLTKTARSSTGGYDRGSDEYWYYCECGLCEKRWMEDQ